MTTSDGSWGYSIATTGEAFATMYERLMEALHSIGLFSGFCYTQFADTYQEANGLLYADRRPKIPLARIAEATRGIPQRTETGEGQAASLSDGLTTPDEPTLTAAARRHSS